MENARDEDQHGENLLNREEGACGGTIPLSIENPSVQQPHDLSSPVPNTNLAALVTHQLSLGTSENEGDQNPPKEKEDMKEGLLTLDPEHPMYKKVQDVLENFYRKRVEALKLEVNEKRAIRKESARELEVLKAEFFQTQEQVTRMKRKLDDSYRAKAQAVAQKQRAQDHLEKAKIKYSNMSSQSRQAKAKASRLQAELDKKMQQVAFAQAVSEDMHSKVKTMNNARQKVGTEKTQAEEEKIKQDLLIERLTKDLENQTQQVARYEVQQSAQAEERLEVAKALSEAEMELESLLTMHKNLLQQWNRNIRDIKKQDETILERKEAVRSVEDNVIFLDREIESYKKLILLEQEKNETLTGQLKQSEKDCVTWEKIISQKQMDGEALQAQYSTCLNSMSVTKETLATLTKEMSTHQTELNNQRSQIEKLSSARLELEEKIMAHIQQQLTHSNAATCSQRLTDKKAKQKKKKMHQLQQLERDTLSVTLESQKVEQQVNSLTLTVETLDEEIEKYNKLLTSHEKAVSSGFRQIEQKETTIAKLRSKISNIVERTGHDDLSPLHIKIQQMLAQVEELAAHIKKDQHLWTLKMGTLEGLNKDLEANSKKIRKLQSKHTAMQQKEIRLEGHIKQEEGELAELEKSLKQLKRDRENLNKLMKKNQQQSDALEEENWLMETHFTHKLKDAEKESVSVQVKLEKTQEEKENLSRSLLEADKQIILLEKRIQILKETRSLVESKENKEEIAKMKAEIHRMELRVAQLTKKQNQLMRESEAALAKRENRIQRKEAMERSLRKGTKKDELKRSIEGIQRKIQKTTKEVEVCERTIKELENEKTILGEKILQEKQHISELSATNTILDKEIVNHRDDHERDLVYLISMQNRNKKLKEVCEGTYKATSSSETVGAALQSQKDRLEGYSNVLTQNSEALSQHQGSLRRLKLSVEAYVKMSQK